MFLLYFFLGLFAILLLILLHRGLADLVKDEELFAGDLHLFVVVSVVLLYLPEVLPDHLGNERTI